MKKILYIICVAGSILSSCAKESDEFKNLMSSTTASFSNAVITRVDGEQWELSDQIGLYMIDGQGEIDTYNNIPYTTSSSGSEAAFSPSSKAIYFKNSDDKVAFWAYSPYDDELINNSAIVDISKDQSQPGAIDLLWAQTDVEYSKDSPNVSLEFKHILSKLSLNIEVGEGVTPKQLEQGITIKAGGFATLATFSLVDQLLTVDEPSDELVELREVTPIERYELILIPDSKVDLEATVIMGEMELKWVLDDFDFESGIEYTYTLTIANDGITVSSSSINGWNYGQSDDLVASKHLFSGGNGTEDDPYLISKVGDLENLAVEVDNKNNFSEKYFKLIKDIDLECSVDNPWSPIGDSADGTYAGPSFCGIFDGNNKSIRGLYVYNENYGGFIGSLGVGGVVKNLTVYGDIVANSTKTIYCGGIVGIAPKNFLIDNCVSYVNIDIDVSFARTGGIVGEAMNGIISNCVNYGDIYVPDGCVGGITSTTRGLVINCSNHGNLDDNYGVGGIVGAVSYSKTRDESSYGLPKSIINCYNSGNIKGIMQIGGIIGNTNGEVVNCYSTAEITPKKDADLGYHQLGFGGVIGDSQETESYNYTGTLLFPLSLSNCYFDQEVNDGYQYMYPVGLLAVGLFEDMDDETYYRQKYYNIVGHRTKYMQSEELVVILNHVAAIYNEKAIYPAFGWEYDAVNRRPVLNHDVKPERYKISSGSGTESSPYKLSSKSDLLLLAGIVNSGTTYDGSYFEITSDIDLTGGCHR